ncbi:unnamed protein product [Peniophora sp. CBMAI 1063]|nr:unnamed protein product [Peniophora sp. CBMAI 1063]
MLHNNFKSDALLGWCSSNGVSIDCRLRIVSDPAGHVCVLLRRSCSFSTGESVSEIPKDAVLSVRSSQMSEFLKSEETAQAMRRRGLDPDFGHGAQLLLATALYAELSHLSSSRWAGYLSSLPQADEWDGTGLLWCEREGGQNSSPVDRLDFFDDVSAAVHWLEGTEVARHLSDDDGKPVADNVRNFYHDVACPLFIRRWPDPRQVRAGDCDTRSVEGARMSPGSTWSLDGFRHAYALVCARAFVVDAFHGLAMVPVADAFNHANSNHVHLETEYDVCPDCGSWARCAHDEDDGPMLQQDHGREESDSASEPSGRARKRPRLSLEEAVQEPSTLDEENTCEMIVNTPLAAPGDEDVEVFNTYGRLSNAALVARYGFALDDAEDGVPISPSFVLSAMSVKEREHDRLIGEWREVLRDWDVRGEGTWTGSSRISQEIELGEGEGDMGFGADSGMSHSLWVLIALIVWEQARRGTGGEHEDAVPALRLLAARLVLLESRADERAGYDDEEDGEDDDPVQNPATREAHAPPAPLVAPVHLDVSSELDACRDPESSTLRALLAALRRVCAARWARIAGGPAARVRLAAMAQDLGINKGADVLAGAETDEAVDFGPDDVDPVRGSGAAGAVLDALEGKKGWSRSRAAITVALGEMSVLESAWARWGEVMSVLSMEDPSGRGS